MWVRILASLLVITALAGADDRVRKAAEQLAVQASVFQSVARDLIARETLVQRALKPVKRKFSPHLGTTPAREPEWQTREIVSEYGYAMLDETIREFRRPVSVDGKMLPENRDGIENLAAGLRSGDENSKRKLLENFEKLGLIGTATDFGQLLLLFERRNQDNYEFSLGEERLVGAERVLTLAYRQADGPPNFTVWKEGRAHQKRVRGEILVRKADLVPLRIRIAAVTGEGKDAVREEAEVDYAMSDYGVVLPVSVVHREYRAGRLVAENRFRYSPFRRFGSTTSLRFP